MPKKLDRIFGFLKHEDEEVPFFFSTDTFQLVLYPAVSNECGGFSLKAFERMADDSQKNKWADNPEIEGMTSEGYHIIFCISGIPAYKNSLIEYKVNWAFYWAGEHDVNAIEGIQVSGNDVDRFYDPSRVLKQNAKLNEKTGGFEEFAVRAEKATPEDYGHYLMHLRNEDSDSEDETKFDNKSEGVNVQIKLSAYATMRFHSNTPMSSASQMNLSFDNPVNLDGIWQAFGQVWNFVQYVTYRSGVRFDDLLAYWKDKEERYVYQGRFLWRRLYSASPLEEKDFSPYEYVIPCDLLKGKVADIFTMIDSGEFSFEHFCSTVSARHHYGTGRIIEILTDFEREYRNIYGTNSLRDDSFISFRDDLVNELAQKLEILHGKPKKWMKDFIKILSNYDDAYKGCVLNALRDCKDIIFPFLQRDYKSDSDDIMQEIAERAGQMRNDYAHSNLNVRLEPVHLTDLKTLERLIYIIRLKKIGMDTIAIQKAINELFHESMVFKETEKEQKDATPNTE